ncbi:unnamed protein product, partial [marine sediment metagenome]
MENGINKHFIRFRKYDYKTLKQAKYEPNIFITLFQ